MVDLSWEVYRYVVKRIENLAQIHFFKKPKTACDMKKYKKLL